MRVEILHNCKRKAKIQIMVISFFCVVYLFFVQNFRQMAVTQQMKLLGCSWMFEKKLKTSDIFQQQQPGT